MKYSVQIYTKNRDFKNFMCVWGGGGQIPYSPTQSGNRCNVSAVFNKGKYISNGTLKWAFYTRVNLADVLLGFLLLLKVAHLLKTHFVCFNQF